MDRFSAPLLKHRRLVTVLFVVAALICAVLSLGVNTNYNITDYLPEHSESTIAIELMHEQFTQAVPNARVMVDDVSITEALDYKQGLGNVPGVSDVMWLDDIINIREPLEMADQDVVEQYYKDGSAVFSLAVASGSEIEAIDAIYEMVGQRGAATGDAVTNYTLQKMAGNETTLAVAIAVPLILLVLLLTSTSWIEPLLFLAAIGVAVLLNMGTNLVFGEVSFVTRSVSPILQLAVSLDYAIFLLHRFAECREETDDVVRAMQMAMRRSFSAIIASALTTLFGFTALTFMQFQIGPDLGVNLIKGIALSFISVMVFLPALTVTCYKLIDRTRHRPIIPLFRTAGRYILKARIPILIIVALLVVPCFMAQGRSSFIYGIDSYPQSMRSYSDNERINATFGSSMAMGLLVPIGDVAREAELTKALEQIPNVNSVMSYANTVGATIPPEYLDPVIVQQFYSSEYARIILYSNTRDEGPEAVELISRIRQTSAEYYDQSYLAGRASTLYDMRNVTNADSQVVNILAIVAILLVLLVTFRSLSLPLLLVLTIETSIWINMSIPYFLGDSFSYVGYLIISTVSLGATVDYAILYTDNYLHQRKKLPSRQAATTAHGNTFHSIIVSALILTLAGFALWFTSSNPIVQDLGLLLCRGTVFSFIMVTCFLPGALVILDRFIKLTTFKPGFFTGKHSEEQR